jgi:glycosyltransferase involved in cell wall biosynthesis
VRVSFLVPAFNEVATIEELLRRVDALEMEKQIIVVDDGSTDDTLAAAEAWARDRDYVIVLHQENRGKGAALQHRRRHRGHPRQRRHVGRVVLQVGGAEDDVCVAAHDRLDRHTIGPSSQR